MQIYVPRAFIGLIILSTIKPLLTKATKPAILGIMAWQHRQHYVWSSGTGETSQLKMIFWRLELVLKQRIDLGIHSTILLIIHAKIMIAYL